jgi:hypothetical protein
MFRPAGLLTASSKTLLFGLVASRLGGVVVSVLATGHKGRGFKLDRGDGFLRAVKIRGTPSFGLEVQPEACKNHMQL